jgi:hypothetical protein
MSRVTKRPNLILISHGILEKDKFVVIPEGITIYTYAKSGNSVRSSTNVDNEVRIYEEGSIMPEMNLDFNTYLPPGLRDIKLKYSVPGFVLPSNVSPEKLPNKLRKEYITKVNFEQNNATKHVMQTIESKSIKKLYNVFEKSNAPGAQAFKKNIKLSAVLHEVSKDFKGIIGLFACRGCDGNPFANLPGSKNSILRNNNNIATPRNRSNTNNLNPTNYLTKFWKRCNLIKGLRFSQVGLTIPKNANDKTKNEIKLKIKQVQSLKDVIKNISEKANETCVTKSELSVYIKIWFYLRKLIAIKNGINIENKLLNKEDGVTYNKLTRYIKNKGVNVEVPSEGLRRGFLL